MEGQNNQNTQAMNADDMIGTTPKQLSQEAPNTKNQQDSQRPKRKHKSTKKDDDDQSIDDHDEEQDHQNGTKKTKLNDESEKEKANQNESRASLVRQPKYSYKKDLEREWPDNDAINKIINPYLEKVKDPKPSFTKQELELIYQCMDLTSLNSTDNETYLKEWMDTYLLQPFQKNKNLRPAAICVYPNFSRQVRNYILENQIVDTNTAVVSTNFPSGQTFIECKLMETKMAIKAGAQEVDMVISRGYWNEGFIERVLDEIVQVKKVCGNAELKVILENCELKDLASVYKISYLSLCAGADFIKTSTGKGTYGAKLDQFAVMCQALMDFTEDKDDKSRGIKAAGGIQDCQTAWKYIKIATEMTEIPFDFEQLPLFVRLGASSLSKNVLSELAKIEEQDKQQEPVVNN